MQSDRPGEIDPSAPASEQAAAWWVLLNSGSATTADHRAFEEWVSRSPERVETFLRASCLSRALKAETVRWPDTPVDILIDEAKAATGEVIDLQIAPRSQAQSGRRRVATFAAAAAATLAALAVGLYFLLGPQRFSTGIGEQRTIVLTDGSVVTLNTESVIQVRMTKQLRSVVLVSGEALFQAAHEAARPFDVTVGRTTVRAVGTQFNVDHRIGGTTVTVVEGKVAVVTEPIVYPGRNTRVQKPASDAQVLLGAGEQLTVSLPTAPSAVHTVRAVRANITSATAWTQRKLVFDHRPLGEVAAEFNRYNRRVIEIQSAALREQRVTGVFQADDPESFMTFLEMISDVSIERAQNGRRFIVRQEE